MQKVGDCASQDIQISVPWGHIAAKVYGVEAKIRVLLVHGTLDNAGAFDRLIPLLPKNAQYVSIDLPGHGLSSHFPHGAALYIFNYVYALKLVVETLKWETFIYIGHSLGAQLGIYFNGIYPNRCQKIVALDGLLAYSTEVSQFSAQIREYYDFNNYAKNSDKLYTEDEVLHALQFMRHSALYRGAAEALFKRAVTKVGDLYKYNRDPRLRKNVLPFVPMEVQLEFIKKQDVPILLILHDSKYRGLILSYLSLLKEEGYPIPQIKIVTVEGNHDVHNNSPEKVAPHICQFITKYLNSKL